MTTKKATKTTKKRVVNKRTIEVDPLDLLMICTGEPKTARTDTLKRTLDENPKNKSSQEAKAKLLEFEKKQSAEKKLKTSMKELILKYNFDMSRVHADLIGFVLTGALSESDFDYLIKNEKYIIEDIRSEISPKELTRDCMVKAILEVGGACVKNGELSKEAFDILMESLGIKPSKTKKDFKVRLFKACIEQFTHKGGDTTRKVIFKDEITNPNEVIPDDGTVFTVDIHDKQIDVIVLGKGYEKITVAENVVDTVLPQQKPGNIE